MSLQLVLSITNDLPYSIREQVIDYARSVDTAIDDIQQEAEVVLSVAEADQLVFLAGLRKLHGICSSSFWALENSGYMLDREGSAGIRIGGTDYSRGGEFYRQLRAMLDDLERIIAENDIPDEVMRSPYHSVARWIAGGRQAS